MINTEISDNVPEETITNKLGEEKQHQQKTKNINWCYRTREP